VLLVVITGLVAAASWPAEVCAATLTVTTDSDSGPGSLRSAILEAEVNGEPDTIVFASDYSILLATQLPTVTTDITIRGNGWDRTIIDGNNPQGGMTGVRAFFVDFTGSLTLDGVMVRNCSVANYDPGGAVSSRGALRVVNSALRDNAAERAYGGAIVAESQDGSLQLLSTRFESNSAPHGGAVFSRGTTTIERCSFVGNRAVASAALEFSGNRPLQLRSSTFSMNHGYSTINIGFSPLVQLEGVTITASTGTALSVFSASVTLSHSILARSGTANCEVYPYAGGSIVSAGHNIEDANTCGLSPATFDLVDTDPMLGRLADPGHLPPWHPLQAGSPAVDGGALGCPMATDQASVPRPVDGDGDGVARCDVGAVERGGLHGDDFESESTTAWSLATS
jgi:predicted outer membrane repeat protein